MADKISETELVSILGRIRANTDMLHATTKSLSTNADRVFGGRPENVGGSPSTPVPDGEINAIGRALDALQDIAINLSDEASRFNRL